MLNSFPQELFQKKCRAIVHEILGKDYIKLFIGDFILFENDKEKNSTVKCKVFFSNEWKDLTIEGTGYGVVDALFNSILKIFSKDFFSLDQIEFEDFSMQIKFKSFKVRPTDAPVEMKLALVSACGKRIYFSAQSRSMVVASISVIRKAFEYLINAEIAFKQLSTSIQEATKRNRMDLIDKYTNQMVDLVNIISYEGIFDG